MMGWLLRDERNMRRHRPPAQHHDPPLGWHRTLDELHYLAKMRYDGAILRYDRAKLCGDCGWTVEGEFEKCEEHEDE